MATDPYSNSTFRFINDELEGKLHRPSRLEVKPQYVHHLTSNPPSEVGHLNVPTHKDRKQRCINFAVAATISLLLLVLVTGILLAYYFSSSCVHGLQCGDGSCVWESQWCDGVSDCPTGQDEANCIKLHGSSFLLQIYSTQTKTWRSVCSHGWSDVQGRSCCSAMGYSRGTYFNSEQQRTDSHDGFLTVKSDLNPEAFILQQLVHSDTCPNNSVVTLRCTDCGDGLNSSQASLGSWLHSSRASLGSWPWQVSVLSGSHRCGGAIISPYWIVTAAHCVSSRASGPADWAVYAGIVDPLGPLFNPARPVSRIITHEAYDHLTHRNNIALIRLSKALDMTTGSSKISPVCLPHAGVNLSAPHTAWITSFSGTAEGDSARLETPVVLINTEQCNSSSALNGRISQDMICAREKNAGGDLCYTDSGSPLVTLRDGLWWLIGDNIWGEDCTQLNTPGVYGNVTYFLDWIHRQMKKHQHD